MPSTNPTDGGRTSGDGASVEKASAEQLGAVLQRAARQLMVFKKPMPALLAALMALRELIAEVVGLREENAELKKRVGELEAEVSRKNRDKGRSGDGFPLDGVPLPGRGTRPRPPAAPDSTPPGPLPWAPGDSSGTVPWRKSGGSAYPRRRDTGDGEGVPNGFPNGSDDFGRWQRFFGDGGPTSFLAVFAPKKAVASLGTRESENPEHAYGDALRALAEEGERVGR